MTGLGQLCEPGTFSHMVLLDQHALIITRLKLSHFFFFLAHISPHSSPSAAAISKVKTSPKLNHTHGAE